jgi:hypothetical protein
VPIGPKVDFDLEVLNETYRRFKSRHCELVFTPDGSVTTFKFV